MTARMVWYLSCTMTYILLLVPSNHSFTNYWTPNLRLRTPTLPVNILSFMQKLVENGKIRCQKEVKHYIFTVWSGTTVPPSLCTVSWTHTPLKTLQWTLSSDHHAPICLILSYVTLVVVDDIISEYIMILSFPWKQIAWFFKTYKKVWCLYHRNTM